MALDTRSRKKVCNLCVDNVEEIDFADVGRMRRYLTDRGKILPRRITGTCSTHQRRLAHRIKTARQAGLIPYVIVN